MRIDYFGKNDLPAIESIIKNYKFNEYRNYRILKKAAVIKRLLNQIKYISRSGKRSILVAKNGALAIGLLSLIDLRAESKFFGFNMARIGHVLTPGANKNDFIIKEGLVKHCMRMCKRRNIAHLSARVDADDTSLSHALEANGFKIMDTIVTYIFNKHRREMPQFKQIHKVRPFRSGDLKAVLDISREVFIKSRYYKDPHLSKKGADLLHAQWIKKNCLNNKNKVLVAYKDNEILGFSTYTWKNDFKKLCDVSIMVSSHTAVRPKAKGAIVSLETEAYKKLSKYFDICESTTQLTNYEIIKFSNKIGFDFVGARHTFHAYLGQD